MSRPGCGSRRCALAVLLLAAGAFVVQIGWAVTTPPFAGIDEFDHAYRASSIALGHVLPPQARAGSGGTQDIVVRDDIAREGSTVCHSFARRTHCDPSSSTGSGTVAIASTAARYDPAYYVATGLLSRPFRGTTALYAMRVVTMVWSVALLATTWWLLARSARTIWPTLLVLVGLTPQVFYSTSIATPNGLNIVAGLCLWAALARLFLAPEHESPPMAAVTIAVLAAVTLLLTHSLGLLWVPAITGTALLATGFGPLRVRVNRARVAFVAGTSVVALVALTALAWVLLAHTNDPTAEPAVFPGNPVLESAFALVLWPFQAIAAFPYRDQTASPAVYAVWLVLVLVAVVLSRRAAGPRLRLAGIVLVVASFALPLVLTIATYRHLGVAWQGRYGLPYSLGLFVLGGVALDKQPPYLPGTATLGPVAVLLGAGELWSWHSTIDSVSAKPLWREGSLWHAPGDVRLLCLAGLAIALWSAGLAMLRPQPEPAARP